MTGKQRQFRIEANHGTEALAETQKRIFGRVCAAAWVIRASSPQAAIKKAAKSLQRDPESLHVCWMEDAR